jgi:hypothetical protein
MAMTYNSLLLQVQDYLQRTDADTIAQIPNFVFLAQHQLCTDLEVLGIEQYINGVFIPGVAGGAVIQKPGGWRRTLSFNYGNGTNFATRNILETRSYEYLVNYWPTRSSTNPPLYYADYGFSDWLIAPTPDQAYPYEICYIGLPVPLSINVQTNWWTNYAPHALFFGAMIQSSYFVRNPESLQFWQNSYDKAISGLKQQDIKRIIDRSTKRDAD